MRRASSLGAPTRAWTAAPIRPERTVTSRLLMATSPNPRRGHSALSCTFPQAGQGPSQEVAPRPSGSRRPAATRSASMPERHEARSAGSDRPSGQRPATGLEAPAAIAGPGLAPPHRAGRECAPTGMALRTRATRSRSISARASPGPSDARGDDVAPGVDDHRVAVALPQPRVVVPPVLGRRQHVALALDGPRPQERLPVVPARRQRERRRHAEDLGPVAHQPAIEVAEPQVVADRQAQPAQRRRDDDRRVARRDALRLAAADRLGDVDVEEVDLAVGGQGRAVGAEQDAGVVAAGRLVARAR